MEREDFISKHWEVNSDEREPWMDSAPPPAHAKGHFDPRYESLIKEGQATKESVYHEKEAYEQKLLIESLNKLAQTEDGYRVLRWLCSWLAFKDSTLALTNSGVDFKSMLYNEARRNVWGDLRKKLSVPNRNRIEEDK